MKAIVPILLFAAANAEQYSFDFRDFTNPSISQPGSGRREPFRHRMLKEASCAFEGDKLVCDHAFEVETDTGAMLLIQFTARCDGDRLVRFNYQKAANCQCGALVSSLDGKPPKYCPCTVCEAGFGDVPVNVDCTQYEEEYQASLSNATSTVRSGGGDVLLTDSVSIGVTDDALGTAKLDDEEEPVAVNETTKPLLPIIHSPYVVGTCTSIDCGSACNGTCDLNCANSDTACPYCANAAQNQPTMTPTGFGNGDLPGLPTESGTPASTRRLILLPVVLAISLIIALL